MTELVAFRLLIVAVGLWIVFACYRIQRALDSWGWRVLGGCGALYVVYAVAGLVAGPSPQLQLLLPVLVTGVAVAVSVLLYEFPDHDSVLGQQLLLVTSLILIAGGMVGGLWPRYTATVLYALTPLLVLPTAYGLYRLQLLGEHVVWRWMLVSTVLLGAGAVLDLAAAAACPDCAGLVYAFPVPFQLPVSSGVAQLLMAGPVLVLAASLLSGFAVYLFYHGVFRPIELVGGDLDVVRLVRATVQNMSVVIGDRPAATLAERALASAGVEHPEVAADGTVMTELNDAQFRRVAVALGDTYGDVGPVGRRIVADTVKEVSGDT